MANLSITTTKIQRDDGEPKVGEAGEAIDEGDLIMRSADDGLLYQGDATLYAAGGYEVVGIAGSGATASGETILYAGNTGVIDISVSTTLGEAYYMSETKGQICLRSDVVTSGDALVMVAISGEDMKLKVNIVDTGAVVA